MKAIQAYKQAYFLGIGGIGMSAICRYFHEIGMKVGGYDKTETVLTRELSELGIEITFNDNIDTLPHWVLDNINETLFVITPAIPKEHPQKCWLKEKGTTLLKRAEVLGLITQDSICLAVAGTHGKTTTSTLLAHILHELNWEFSAFLGGISSNFNSNYIKNSGKPSDSGSPIVIVEADEFDRSFHKLFPNAAIITAIDADHLDIYETKEAFEEAFHIFARQVKKSDNNGLFVNQDLIWPKEVGTQTYGFAPNSDYAIGNIQIKEGSYHFEITHQKQSFAFKAGLPGYHNVLNAGAAIALCNSYLHIPLADLIKPIANFKGVKRRFEYLVNQPMAAVIDDYAHHPEELNMIINSVKDLYPEKKITGIFQPHLFSRTQDFAKEFAQSLEQLDQVYLLEIYPAREKPIPGITSSYLVSLMEKEGAQVISKEAFLDIISADKPEVLLILGAGDIDTLRQPLIEIYE